MELNIESLTPMRLDLEELVERFSELSIDGVDDTAGYKRVDEARKTLKRKRVEISKFAKSIRDEAIQFQRDVIKKEKELISIIEPVESGLTDKQLQIDNEKLKTKMVELLPERRKRLEDIDVSGVDDLILLMDERKFESYYIDEKQKYLQEKERIIKEKEAEQERKEEIKRAEERVKKEAEERAARELEQEKERAAKEKQELIDKIKREKESVERAKVEAKEREEREQKKLAEQKRFQDFLKKNKYKDTEDFYLLREQDRVVLYKKIDILELN